MKTPCLVLLCLVLAIPVGGRAQDTRDQALSGLRVRVVVAELGTDVHMGELAEVDRCLYVRVPMGKGTVLGVPLGRVGRLEISASVANREFILSGQPVTDADGSWRTADLGTLRMKNDQRCENPPFTEVTPLILGDG